MNTFYATWKKLANEKKLTSTNFIERALYKAIKSKNENKEDIFLILLKKYFTRRKKDKTYDVIGNKVHWLLYSLKYFNDKKFLGIDVSELFDKEELVTAISLLEDYKKFKRTEKVHRQYVHYFTVNKDDNGNVLPPVHKGVQSAHLLYALGARLLDARPHETYFQWHEVESSKQIKELRDKYAKYGFVTFTEPDMGDTVTGIAFYPIPWFDKTFSEFPLTEL